MANTISSLLQSFVPQVSTNTDNAVQTSVIDQDATSAATTNGAITESPGGAGGYNSSIPDEITISQGGIDYLMFTPDGHSIDINKLTLADFAGLSDADKSELVNLKGLGTGVNSPWGIVEQNLGIGSPYQLMLSSDKTTVYNLANMSLADVAQMPTQDKALLAASPYYSTLATKVQFTALGITSPDDLMLGANKSTVYILSNLTQSDVANMPPADQKSLTQVPSWLTLAANLNLSVAADGSVIVPTGTSGAISNYIANENDPGAGDAYQTSIPASEQEIVARSSIPYTHQNQVPTNTFLSWDTATQVAFLKPAIIMNNDPNTLVPGRSIAFGIADGVPVDADASKFTWAMLSTDNKTVYILNNLQKTDIASMSLADQLVLTHSPYWPTLATRLNLCSADDTQMATVNAQISALKTEINNAPTAASDSVNGMTTADKQVFLDEITNLNNQLAKIGVYSPVDIQNQLNAIKTRFERVQAFSLQKVPTTQDNNGVPAGLVSTDGNATILSGYQKFMQQEQQILSVANAAASLAGSSTLEGKKLDVPTMIYYFQMYANLSQQASIAADTEEVNQLNALLDTYSQMQTDVNATLASFGNSTSDTDTRTFMNASTRASLTTQQLDLSTIFEDAAGYGKSPLESMYGIQKPTADFFFNSNPADSQASLNGQTKSWWTDFANSLSNTVTQINQQTQIKMNNLDSAIKQKDNEFDLGNNALSKLADMIQSISRGLS